MFLGICLTFQSPPILLLMEKMTYNCYYIGIRMMHIAFCFPLFSSLDIVLTFQPLAG